MIQGLTANRVPWKWLLIYELWLLSFTTGSFSSPFSHRPTKKLPNKPLFGSKSISQEESDRFIKLEKFLEEKECEGLSRLKVDIDRESSCRGLFCGEAPIIAGEYILAIPILSSLTIFDSLNDGNQALSDNEDVQEAVNFLTTYANDPHWEPYLSCLPKINDPNFDATPDFWDPEIVRELEIPSLISDCLERQHEIDVVAEKTRIDPADLKWATWIVRSRRFTTFQIISQDGGMTSRLRRMLVPFVDMVNHDVDPNAEVETIIIRDADDESMHALVATRDIEPGEQVTIGYNDGRATCLDLFDRYGFWLTENPADDLIDWDLVDPQWSTTLEEDERLFAGPLDGALRTAVSMRIHLKHVQQMQ
jgi:hypothetical protein